MKSAKVKSVILCEEVRREASGSAILIGARPSGPTISDEEPTVLPRLALYIELEVPFPSPRIIAFRLRDIVKNYNLIEHSFELPKSEDDETDDDSEIRGVVVSVINEDDVLVKGPGIFCVQAKYDGSKWTTVRDFVFPSG
jgi:hypothetical protein